MEKDIFLEENLLSKVYAELYEIFKSIEKEKVMKIPQNFLLEIKSKRDLNYKFKINWNIDLEKNNFHQETINILGWINYNFWMDNEIERKKFWNVCHNTYDNQNPIQVYRPSIVEKIIESMLNR